MQKIIQDDIKKKTKVMFNSHTYFNQKKSSSSMKNKTPPKNKQKTFPDFQKKNKKLDTLGIINSSFFKQIVLKQKDQRFRYLLKHGTLKKVQKNGNIIFSELPQIPKVWVCYRRPQQRQNNLEKLILDDIDLVHLPLLQGQQKLKMLSFQKNKIQKIQNLISLHNLLYIDLYDNQIIEIENLNVVPTLKVLLLSKNNITKIKNLNQLVKLQVIDLHSNKICKIEGLKNLQNLRILNLANNSITKIQNLQSLYNLTQLNLKLNLIAILQNIKSLTKLQKLFIANNKIQRANHLQEQFENMLLLKQLTIQNNVLWKNKQIAAALFQKVIPSLTLLDGKNPHQYMKQQKKSQTPPINVRQSIQQQWKFELQKIKSLQKKNVSKKEILKSSLITAGHAQIDDQISLYIYGNSYDVVLNNPTFHEGVEKIRFQFIYFQHLIQPNTLSIIKKFKQFFFTRKLKTLEFSYNYITSLLQLAKLQTIGGLKTLIIQKQDNPIIHFSNLKQFIVYRFPHILQLNRQDIKQSDRLRAKTLFHYFDKVLQIPQKIFNIQTLKNYQSQISNAKAQKNYLKNWMRVISQVSQKITANILSKSYNEYICKTQFEHAFEQIIIEMIESNQKKKSQQGKV